MQPFITFGFSWLHLFLFFLLPNEICKTILTKYFFFVSFSLQSPPKGATIPYRPKPQVNGPVILANGQAFALQGNFAVPTQEVIKLVFCVFYIIVFILSNFYGSFFVQICCFFVFFGMDIFLVQLWFDLWQFFASVGCFLIIFDSGDRRRGFKMTWKFY